MAGVWVNMARMVNGEVEAHNVLPFCVVAGVLAGLLPVLSLAFPKLEHYLPSGIGFAMGLCVPSPSLSLSACMTSPPSVR
jgi:hypothetical protein